MNQLRIDIDAHNTPIELKLPVEEEMDAILQNHELVTKTKTMKKLNKLYQGEIKLKETSESFINLSNYQPTIEQKQFLNMGLNYHLQPKYIKLEKSTQLEILYQDLLKLESTKHITINPNLCDQLRSESTKHRNCYYKSKITPKLKLAAKELFENQNIIIKKADKSSTYVIMDKLTYMTKLNNLISDPTKFKQLIKDPTNKLKVKANKLISTVNTAQNNIKNNKIQGEYKPGYIYGTVKVHKQGFPLRPILSQVTSPIYQLAKTLNQIITPYIPAKYSLKSTNDFIDLLETKNFKGHIGSLDVESLFTNVPIDHTINIILEVAYNHPTITPPKLPKILLKQLLELCTKESPFTTPEGKIYVQTEGVAMGSPLGPSFANFYMGYLEEQTFTDNNNKLPIYARYVDDIFVGYNNPDDLNKLKTKFEENSILKFTIEKSTENKLPFLDVLVENCNNYFHTQVYHKPTDKGQCLNADSECPERYKISVINNYIKRAYKISKTWQDFHSEMNLIKQILVNNNYSNNIINKNIKNFIDQKHQGKILQNQDHNIKIYYKAQMHKNYKTDERILKEIIARNVKCVEKNTSLKTIIYYNSPKTSNSIIKNNSRTITPVLQTTNVVYKFTCNFQNCKSEYIGLTQLTLEKRLTAHYYKGSIKNHYQQCHNITPTKQTIYNNTKILTKERNYRSLAIKECLFILHHQSKINIQQNNYWNIMKLHQSRSNYNTQARQEDVIE